ncbi:hypothetical protein RIR_jg14818.t1 [Rhizophagus irregularis DAOM 181602=DAOM 197198]|nr:hypothetical protein RIR_jg14818.t1 [Rhizophagus irregularis DAOM 181602=DAOM 197198]
MQEVRKGRTRKERTRKERISSLGTAISVISKNVKDAERTDAERTFSSFGVVIGNRGKCEVDTWIDSTHRLVWSTTASVLIFGFGYIGFGFSFWVLDSFLAIKRRTAHFGCGFRYDDFGRHFELVLCLLDAILVRL